MFANTLKSGKVYFDSILVNNTEAKKKAELIGQDKVINGTVGSLCSEGSLVTFDAVESLIPGLNPKQISAYTPMQGLPAFLEAVKGLCFQSYFPKKHVKSVAVTGGLGGIRQAIINYTEVGDLILTSDWHWGPYNTVAEDNLRKIALFRLFDGNRFNFESFAETVEQTARLQKKIFLLINTPAHNPTGFSLSPEDWDKIIDFLNNTDAQFVLFLDMAYIEFAPEEQKRVFQKLDLLKPHIFPIINYSISKGLAKYGFRVASLIGVHEDVSVVNELSDIIAISNRGNYGCVPSMGQYLTAALWENKSVLARYYKEKEHWKNVLKRRAEAFLGHIHPDLPVPYESGFFISVKSDNPKAHADALKEENIYLVPLKDGIRVAICSIDEEKLPAAADAVNRVMGAR